jgi:hypothetical protein
MVCDDFLKGHAEGRLGVGCGLSAGDALRYAPNPNNNESRPTTIAKSENPLQDQQGGDHYKIQKIQPVQYIHANGLGFIEGNIVKYITRHRLKNGIEDLRKIAHYVELLAELEYNEKI